ncbi:hypothetical protein BU16DRAFT_537653 [Lophium mytilinum]|uniref:Uncharacterized protein n=1 Tax=Lophium mytilinum TaxID=390894 RepID=A0A6A6R2P4_9PEZI|nr:hypothetical protein BU16DRAFT_537653 [Lophium mytilinum]
MPILESIDVDTLEVNPGYEYSKEDIEFFQQYSDEVLSLDQGSLASEEPEPAIATLKPTETLSLEPIINEAQREDEVVECLHPETDEVIGPSQRSTALAEPEAAISIAGPAEIPGLESDVTEGQSEDEVVDFLYPESDENVWR